MENEATHGALAALSSIEGARSVVAERLVTPGWYHPILGLLTAGLLVVLALGSLPVLLIGLVVYGAGIGVLVGAYKAKTGVWISGYSAGKTSGWAFLLSVVSLVCMLTALGFGRFGARAWPVWAAAGAIFLATIVIGRRFDAAVRAQLRDKP